MGVSVAQRVLESECNVETSDSAKMTNQVGCAWIGRPTVVVVVATWCGTNGIWNGVGWVCFMLCVFSGDLAWSGTSGAMGDFVMFCSCCCLRAVSNRSCSSARYAGSDANNCQGVAWKHGCRLLNSACSPHCVPHMSVVMMWDQYLCGPLRPTLLQCWNNAVRENSWRFPDSFHAVSHIWSHQPQGSCESSLNHIRKRWEGWEEKLGWRVPQMVTDQRPSPQKMLLLGNVETLVTRKRPPEALPRSFLYVWTHPPSKKSLANLVSFLAVVLTYQVALWGSQACDFGGLRVWHWMVHDAQDFFC